MPSIDFFNKTGKMAIGSRLRMLTDTITSNAREMYKMYGVNIKPKWFPVFFVLTNEQNKTVTDIAREIGHSHPSVSNIVKEMVTAGLIQEHQDKKDKRRNVLIMTPKGRQVAKSLQESYADVTEAIETISAQTKNKLWEAIEEWEQLLTAQPLIQYIKEAKKTREGKLTTIVPYEDCHQPAFCALNEEWITAHWQMEESDYKALDHPREYILNKGGHIFIALYNGEVVGTCCLYKSTLPGYDYEMSKLAVSPKVQGKGIGHLLGKTAIDKALNMRAGKIFLESNTILKPAIHLYKKLGFIELIDCHYSYSRGNIQMELKLN